MSRRNRRKIGKVLVVNRGEIAVRIIRALRDRGILSAVVYSTPDREQLPVLLADEAHWIGDAEARESYLKAAEIVELAQHIGADAIHPGYGFLSENAEFAELCRDADVVFIGPSPEAIATLGSKIESRRLMLAAGVPVVPGSAEALPDLGAAEREAERIGFPVMLKAAAGGGGKGMRLVRESADLASAFRAARSEAKTSFGEDSVFLEKAIVRPRHVEIQILGDHAGTVISLGERECSLQRRHQKVVEEAPSPIMTPELRRAMGEAAVKAGEAAGYVGAGTVEFLLEEDGGFYFLEVNTRLQVEPPVTELVTGIDLVDAQLAIAQGEELDPAWAQIEPRGHAIEVRVYAEDPYRGFVPSPGTVAVLRLPEGPGVRCDFGIREGGEVTIHYDPMLGKLIVWGRDRDQALRRLGRALEEMRVVGIQTTLPLFAALLQDEDFQSGNLDIEMLDRKLSSEELRPVVAADDRPLAAIAAAIEHFELSVRQVATTNVGERGSDAGSRPQWRRRARVEALRGPPWNS